VSTDPATTTATGLPLAAGTWPLDGMHSGVHLKVQHIGLTSVHGRFNRFDATLTVGETLADTRLEARPAPSPGHGVASQSPWGPRPR
jgi:polyisoprenoid-binding protein YceI